MCYVCAVAQTHSYLIASTSKPINVFHYYSNVINEINTRSHKRRWTKSLEKILLTLVRFIFLKVKFGLADFIIQNVTFVQVTRRTRDQLLN